MCVYIAADEVAIVAEITYTDTLVHVYMAKGSRKFALWMLLFPLAFVILLRLCISSRNAWKTQAPLWATNLILKEGNGALDEEQTKLLMRRLVQGSARTELSQNGISCVSDPRSTFCVTTAAVRITAGPPLSSTIYLADGQLLSSGDNFAVQPYPRSFDPVAMSRTEPVNLIAGEPGLPPCDVVHSVPAVIFSTGGFAGNFYHDVSEVLVSLFLTAGIFRSNVQLVITDYQPYWVDKYRRFLSHLSAHELVIVSSPYGNVAGSVHCFPAAVVGLKFHDHLLCNASRAPGGTDTLSFKRFLHESLSLKAARLTASVDRPLMLLVSRWKSRVILNEKEVIKLAEEVGFRVELAWEKNTTNVEEFAELANSCSVLMGVHGAGLTNMVFLPSGAVVLQVVPLGLDWHADTYFSHRIVTRLGLKYVEYKTTVEESSLYEKYAKDDPILADPSSINRLGYNVSRPLYIDGQNVTINIPRFRGALLQAQGLLPRPSS